MRCGDQASVGYLKKRVMLRIVHRAYKRLAAVPLTNAQSVPLLRSRELGEAIVANLVRWANTDAGAMSRLLDRLENQGLCVRARKLDECCVVRVSRNPNGKRVLTNVPAVLAEVVGSATKASPKPNA